MDHNTYGGVFFWQGRVFALPTHLSAVLFVLFLWRLHSSNLLVFFIGNYYCIFVGSMGGSEFTSSYVTILNITAPSLIFIASHSLLPNKLKRLRYSCYARCLKGKMSLLMDYALIMAL